MVLSPWFAGHGRLEIGSHFLRRSPKPVSHNLNRGPCIILKTPFSLQHFSLLLDPRPSAPSYQMRRMRPICLHSRPPLPSTGYFCPSGGYFCPSRGPKLHLPQVAYLLLTTIGCTLPVLGSAQTDGFGDHPSPDPSLRLGSIKASQPTLLFSVGHE
jgi:hypothetical protein